MPSNPPQHGPHGAQLHWPPAGPYGPPQSQPFPQAWPQETLDERLERRRHEIILKRRQRAQANFLSKERKRRLKDQKELEALSREQDNELAQLYFAEGWFNPFIRRGEPCDPHAGVGAAAEDDEAASSGLSTPSEHGDAPYSCAVDIPAAADGAVAAQEAILSVATSYHAN